MQEPICRNIQSKQIDFTKKIAVALFLYLFTFSANAQETILAKKEAIDYIETYYSNFKTGYDYHGNIKMTGNYLVEIKGCKCKISFDQYDLDALEKIYKNVIEFNFDEIDSVEEGVNEHVLVYENDLEINLPVNGNIKLLSRQKNIIRKTDALLQKVDAAEIKAYFSFDTDVNSSDTGIIRAFKRLQYLCKRKLPVDLKIN